MDFKQVEYPNVDPSFAYSSRLADQSSTLETPAEQQGRDARQAWRSCFFFFSFEPFRSTSPFKALNARTAGLRGYHIASNRSSPLRKQPPSRRASPRASHHIHGSLHRQSRDPARPRRVVPSCRRRAEQAKLGVV